MKTEDAGASGSPSSNSVCLTPREIETRLREVGVSPTAQRIAIGRFVLCEAHHPTAEDVKKWTDVNFPKLSLATVYNTLKILVKVGLLREFHLPHSEKAIYDNNLNHHHHFYDEETGELVDLEVERCAVKLGMPEEFRMRQCDVFVTGRREHRQK